MAGVEHDDSAIVDPFGEVEGNWEISLAKRPSSLKGQRIALYSNSKKNSDHFLRGIGEAIKEQHPDAQVSEIIYKPIAGAPGTRYGLINKVSKNFDMVLLAYGDCGSCAAYTIEDAIDFERHGLPTVAYSSSKFIDLARYDAFHKGVPGLPIVEFEHPIAQLSEEDTKAKRVTDDVVDETVLSLISDTDDVADRFEAKYDPNEFTGRPSFSSCTI